MPLRRWTYVQSMNVTRSRVALVADMDRLWAIGGYDGMKNLSTVSGKILIPCWHSFNFGAGWDVQPGRRFLVLRGKHGVPRGRGRCGGDSHGLTSCWCIAQHQPYGFHMDSCLLVHSSTLDSIWIPVSFHMDSCLLAHSSTPSISL